MQYLILGNGKTGSELVGLLDPDQILDIITSSNPLTPQHLKHQANIMSFLPPAALAQYAEMLINANCNLVSGTTGYDYLQHHEQLASKGLKWLIASNFSIYVNNFFKQLQLIKAQLDTLCEQPSIVLTEQHHHSKVDAPSGTALKIQELFQPFEIKINSTRCESTNCIHKLDISLDAGNSITLSHQATSKVSFASGALYAAKLLPKLATTGIIQFEDLDLSQY